MSPVQEKAEVLAVSRAGQYTQITVVAAGIAADAKAGQFVSIGVGEADSALILRRSLALAGMTPGGDYAGTIQFVVAQGEPGADWLAKRVAGDILDIVGPLGTAFALPAGPVPAVLVGGGHGAAALLPLARDLMAQGCSVEIVLGAATASGIYGALSARRTAGDVTVTTDDGSAGERARVTDVLPLVISRSRAEVLYACGPMAMLQSVGDVAAAHAIAAHVAVQEPMACGIGVCMTCVLPVRGDDGRSRLVRSCVEGPVFSADRVRWADVGTLPTDLVGADAMGA